MEFTVSNGLNLISVGGADIGTYFRLRYPAAVVWNDCRGSIGQYLCLLPVSEADRLLLQNKINSNLYNDYTGKLEELKDLLEPLFELLANGDYQLSFNNRARPDIAASYSGNVHKEYEMGWYVQYPEIVELDDIQAKIMQHKQHIKVNNLENYNVRIIDATTSWMYDNWEDRLYIATKPITDIDAERIAYFEEVIRDGQRPFAILMDVHFFTEDGSDYSQSYVLDGHHKLQAYKNLEIKPPLAIIRRMFKSPDEVEFDIEALADRMYPWQIKHILDNLYDYTRIAKLMENPESNLHKFVKNGLYEEFHENGRLKHQGHYIINKPDGTIKEWYENGHLKYERNYRDGRLYGTWKEWFENGKPSGICSFDDNGQRHGTGMSYLENGKVKSSNVYNHGIPADGYSFSKYHHTGKMNYEFWHTGGIMVRKKTYADNGSLITDEQYSDELQKLVVVADRYTHRREPLQYPKPKKGEMSLLARILWTALLWTVVVIATEVWRRCSSR